MMMVGAKPPLLLKSFSSHQSFHEALQVRLDGRWPLHPHCLRVGPLVFHGLPWLRPAEA